MIREASHSKGYIYCISNVPKIAFETIIWIVIWLQHKDKLSSSQTRITNCEHLLYAAKQPTVWVVCGKKNSCTKPLLLLFQLIPLWQNKIPPCVIKSCLMHLVLCMQFWGCGPWRLGCPSVKVCRIISGQVSCTLGQVKNHSLKMTKHQTFHLAALSWHLLPWCNEYFFEDMTPLLPPLMHHGPGQSLYKLEYCVRQARETWASWCCEDVRWSECRIARRC